MPPVWLTPPADGASGLRRKSEFSGWGEGATYCRASRKLNLVRSSEPLPWQARKKSDCCDEWQVPMAQFCPSTGSTLLAKSLNDCEVTSTEAVWAATSGRTTSKSLRQAPVPV